MEEATADATSPAGERPLSVGLLVETCSSISSALDQALMCGFEYICAKAYHGRYREQDDVAAAAPPPPDCLMPGHRWTNCVVSCLSDRAAAAFAAESWHDAEACLREELGWAGYLNVPAALLPAPPSRPGPALPRYARLVASVTTAHSTHVWVPVPLGLGEGDADSMEAPVDGWSLWNSVRVAAGHGTTLLSPVLVVGPTLPPQAQVDRWLAEPVKAAILSTNLFLANAGGHPVLPRGHQALLQLLHRHGVQVVVRGQPTLPASAPSHAAYALYLRHCAAKSAPLTAQEAYESPYFDVLQIPLQPLGDHLEAGTYEVFERDTPKYDAYQAAIGAEMAQRQRERGAAGYATPLTVVVVGAGRGPLVLRALAAAVQAGVAHTLRVVAVEKNPNAVITLRELARQQQWGAAVTIVSGDMRDWRPACGVACDILVSELLGSFGDNELSPECLDGVAHVLRPGGASRCIPQAYTSFLAPVSAAKAWSAARAYGDPKYLETPYVVRLTRACTLDAPQPAFTFTHGGGEGDTRTLEALCAGLPVGDCGTGGGGAARPAPPNNTRHTTLRFISSCDAVLHGLAGYFDCTLTDGVRLSIHPANHTGEMSSWFPIFFPLKEPVTVAGGEVVVVHMARCVSLTRRCVWYEWAVTTAHTATALHNAAGSACTIRL